MKTDQIPQNHIVPLKNHFQNNFDITKANDFVYLKDGMLAIATGDGLFFYDYQHLQLIYSFSIGKLLAVEILNDSLLALSEEKENGYSIIIFNYQTQEIVNRHSIDFEVFKIKKIDEKLFVYMGYSEDIVFFDYKTFRIVHTEHTTNHQGVVKRYWIKTAEIVDDEVIVYGGSDCKLSFFNYKLMELLYEVSRPGWIRDIEVFEEKLVATDGGSDKFVVWDYINKEYIYNLYDVVNNYHELKYILYLGDGEIIYGRSCDHPFWVNYKTKEFKRSPDAVEMKKINKKIDAVTSVHENKFCYKMAWLENELQKLPEYSKLINIFDLGDGYSLYVFEHLLIFYDRKKDEVVLKHRTRFKTAEVIHINKANGSAFAFLTSLGEFTILEYNSDQNRVSYMLKGFFTLSMCSLSDNYMLYSTKHDLYLVNCETYNIKHIEEFDYSIKIIDRLDDENILLEMNRTMYIYDVKQQKTITAFNEYQDCRHIVLDDEIVAFFCSSKIKILNFKKEEEFQTLEREREIRNICKIDTDKLLIIEEGNVVSCYDFRQNIMLYEDIALSHTIDSAIKVDDSVVFKGDNLIVIYEDIQTKKIAQSMRICSDDVVSVYDYRDNKLIITDTGSDDLELEYDPFDIHALFMDEKQHKIIPYKSYPQRVELIEQDNGMKKMILS
jgi:WD40 repeat protein